MDAKKLAKQLSCGTPTCGCPRPSGNGWLSHCPSHKDENPSLSLSNGQDGRLLVHCHAGCSQEQVIESLKERDLWPLHQKACKDDRAGRQTKGQLIDKIYDYLDENGELLFQVCKFKPKKFRQRRPDGNGGWIWDLKDVRVVPYNLPNLREAETIFIVEGEKDCEGLQQIGLIASCNPMGAGKWRAEFGRYFKNKDIIVLPDHDTPGRRHAQDIASHLRGIARTLKILELPGLPEKGDVSDWLAQGGTRETLLDLADKSLAWEPVDAGSGEVKSGPYQIIDGGIIFEKSTPNGIVPVPLCNFSAKIIGEEIRDDGAERQTFYKIEGFLKNGRPLPCIEVSAAQFSSLTWIQALWGTRPIVYAGFSIKDHLRAAIQILSGDVPRRPVYGHLGWRQLDDGWAFLHRGGAIGEGGGLPNIAVSFPDAQLGAYDLPSPPSGEELIQAIQVSLEILQVTPARLSFPILAAVYRAPLGECLPIDITLFIAGKSGCQKTELTVLAQAHFGPTFSGRNLPGNWATTGNSLEKMAFLAKDVIFTVDDFAPQGTAADVQRLHGEADRLFRAQGNRAGRGRMRPDGSLRPTYIPRGLLLSSGEDVPQGQSLRARLLILEVAHGDVNLELLTQSQHAAAAGLFAQAMAGYLRWLAPKIDALKVSLPHRFRELRTMSREDVIPHDRTPEMRANLMLGFEQLLEYAGEMGAIKVDDKDTLWQQCWEALRDAARSQAGHIASEDPCTRFLTLLSSAIDSGRAHIVDAGTNEEPESKPQRWGWREKTVGTGGFARPEWQPQGERLGWLDGDNLLLEPEATFAAIQRISRDQGAHLSISQRTLWKRLAEKGYLASKEESQMRNTVRWNIAGQRKRVIHIMANVLDAPSGPTGPTGPSGPRAYGTDKVGTEAADLFEGNSCETVQEIGPEKEVGAVTGSIGPDGPMPGGEPRDDAADHQEAHESWLEEGEL